MTALVVAPVLSHTDPKTKPKGAPKEHGSLMGARARLEPTPTEKRALGPSTL
jgi:hypothetical protein